MKLTNSQTRSQTGILRVVGSLLAFSRVKMLHERVLSCFLICVLHIRPAHQQVNGVWREWSQWVQIGQCNVTCGGGNQLYTRSRVCIQPQFGGQPCQGSANDATTRVCSTNNCPIDGTWNPWSALISIRQCNVTCGGGSQQYIRSRVCNQPQFGGQPCQGSANDAINRDCNTNNCPINGEWSVWSLWVPNGVCNATCGGGSQQYIRSRVCNQPQFGGQPCPGSAKEATTRVCNINNCPIDGNWAPWSSWSVPKCAVSCDEGDIGVVSRERQCTDPLPQFGGRECEGEKSQTSSRLCGLQFCPSKNHSFWLSTSFIVIVSMYHQRIIHPFPSCMES